MLPGNPLASEASNTAERPRSLISNGQESTHFQIVWARAGTYPEKRVLGGTFRTPVTAESSAKRRLVAAGIRVQRTCTDCGQLMNGPKTRYQCGGQEFPCHWLS